MEQTLITSGNLESSENLDTEAGHKLNPSFDKNVFCYSKAEIKHSEDFLKEESDVGIDPILQNLKNQQIIKTFYN